MVDLKIIVLGYPDEDGAYKSDVEAFPDAIRARDVFELVMKVRQRLGAGASGETHRIKWLYISSHAGHVAGATQVGRQRLMAYSGAEGATPMMGNLRVLESRLEFMEPFRSARSGRGPRPGFLRRGLPARDRGAPVDASSRCLRTRGHSGTTDFSGEIRVAYYGQSWLEQTRPLTDEESRHDREWVESLLEK